MRESYSRAYQIIVRAQQLEELEEIIKYKKYEEPENKEHLKQIWKERLLGCQVIINNKL